VQRALKNAKPGSNAAKKIERQIQGSADTVAKGKARGLSAKEQNELLRQAGRKATVPEVLKKPPEPGLGPRRDVLETAEGLGLAEPDIPKQAFRTPEEEQTWLQRQDENLHRAGGALASLIPGDPLNQGDLTADTGSDTADKVLEYFTNRPLQTAFDLTLFGGLGKAGVKYGINKFVAGQSAKKAAAQTAKRNLAKASPVFIVNTKSQRLSKMLLAGAGFTTAAAFFIEKMVSTYPFATFELAEGMQQLSMAKWKAEEAGDYESVAKLNQLEQEILNPEGWDKVLAMIPHSNVQQAALSNIETALASSEAMNKRIRKKMLDEQSTESDLNE